MTIGLFGLARGGHHAISEWLMHFFSHHFVIHYQTDCNHKLISKRLSRKIRHRRTKKTLRWCCFENYDLEGFQEDFKNTFNLVIIVNRDPFNVAASTLKASPTLARGFQFMNNKKPRKSMIKRRKLIKYSVYFNTKTKIELVSQYVRQSLGMINLLGDQKFIDVNYNKWFCSEEYKKDVLEKLHYKYEKVSTPTTLNGGGSSFDGLKNRYEPKAMDVLNRWKHYANNQAFIELFDEETKELSKKYFNFQPI
jgi:hypothetical protein